MQIRLIPQPLRDIVQGKRGPLPQFLTLSFLAFFMLRAMFQFDFWQRLNRLYLDEVLYPIRGAIAADTNVVVVAVDDESARALGFPVPRRHFAELIQVLEALGAHTISFDLLFADQRSPTDDSLLAIASDKETVIHALNLMNGEQTDELTNASHEFEIKHGIAADTSSVGCWKAGCIILPSFRSFGKTFHRLGNIAVLPDVDGLYRLMPLMMQYRDLLYPSLSLKSYLHAYGLENAKLQIESRQFKIQYAVLPTVAIPTPQPGAMMLNFYGDLSAFAGYYSMVDLLRLGWEEGLDSLRAIGYRPFAGKVVLVGNTITGSGDVFPTPFDSQLPGVDMHATALSNLIRREWLVPIAGWLWFVIELASLALCSVVVFWGYLKRGKSLWVSGLLAALLLLLANACALSVFQYFRIVAGWVEWNLVAIVLSLIGWTAHYRWQVEDKKNALRDKEKELQDVKQKLEKVSPPGAYHMVILRIIFEEHDSGYLLVHSIDKVYGADKEPLPELEMGKQDRSAKIKVNQVNRLKKDLDTLHQAFQKYCLKGEIDSSGIHTTLSGDLQDIGKRIFDEFFLTATFNKLFNSNDTEIYLRFVVSDMTIPWHLAHRLTQETGNPGFIAEKYPLSFNFDFIHPIARGNLQKTEPYAVLMGPAYDPELRENLTFLRQLQKALTAKLSNQVILRTSPDEALTALREAQFRNVRLIHFSGHFNKGCLVFGDGCFLRADDIRGQDFGFRSSPIVFINACISATPEKADKWNASASLAIEFLRRGAGACVVTLFKVPDKTSAMFTRVFYEHLLGSGTTVGQALLATMQHLAKPDAMKKYGPENDLTRFAYVIYGDPTIKF